MLIYSGRKNKIKGYNFVCCNQSSSGKKLSNFHESQLGFLPGSLLQISDSLGMVLINRLNVKKQLDYCLDKASPSRTSSRLFISFGENSSGGISLSAEAVQTDHLLYSEVLFESRCLGTRWL